MVCVLWLKIMTFNAYKYVVFSTLYTHKMLFGLSAAEALAKLKLGLPGLPEYSTEMPCFYFNAKHNRAAPWDT